MYSKSSLVSCETTWWGKTHRLQVDLQEQENDRLECENLSGIASGEGVTPRKNVFNTFQPIANINLSGFSHPLYLIGTMRYREWMSRQLSLTEVLRRPFYGSTRRLIAKGQKWKCASCKSPFMNFSRHLGLGTSVLTGGSRHFGFIQCPDEPCVYKRCSRTVVVVS